MGLEIVVSISGDIIVFSRKKWNQPWEIHSQIGKLSPNLSDRSTISAGCNEAPIVLLSLIPSYQLDMPLIFSLKNILRLSKTMLDAKVDRAASRKPVNNTRRFTLFNWCIDHHMIIFIFYHFLRFKFLCWIESIWLAECRYCPLLYHSCSQIQWNHGKIKPLFLYVLEQISALTFRKGNQPSLRFHIFLLFLLTHHSCDVMMALWPP